MYRLLSTHRNVTLSLTKKYPSHLPRNNAANRVGTPISLRLCPIDDPKNHKDNGDGEGPYNATASWGTEEAADSFTTFMDKKTYVSKLEADESEVISLFFFRP